MLKKKKESKGNGAEEDAHLIHEQIEKDIREYEKKYPDGPKPYFDRKTLDEMDAERERNWARQAKMRKIKWAIGLPAALLTAVIVLTSPFGILFPKQVRNLASKAVDFAYIAIEIITNDREHKLKNILRERMVAAEKGDDHQIEEVERAESVEHTRLRDELRQKYGNLTLKEIKEHVSKMKPGHVPSLECFEAGKDPNTTVKEFFATVSDTTWPGPAGSLDSVLRAIEIHQ